MKMRKPLQCEPGLKLSLVIISVSLSIELRIPRGVVALAAATLPLHHQTERASCLPTTLGQTRDPYVLRLPFERTPEGSTCSFPSP